MRAAFAAIILTLLGCLIAFDHGLRASAQEAPCSRLPAAGELAIIGRVPSPRGSVHVPELALTSPIVGGCFEFRDLHLPRSPMLLSFEINAEGFRPATWAHYLVLDQRSGAINFGPALHPGTEPERFDQCPYLLAHPQTMSAALQLHAALCAELPSTGTGIVGGQAHDARLLPVLLLTLLAAGLIFGGAGLQLLRRR